MNGWLSIPQSINGVRYQTFLISAANLLVCVKPFLSPFSASLNIFSQKFHATTLF